MHVNATPEPTTNPLGFMASSTPQLRATIAQLRQQLPPEEFESLLGNVRSLFEKFKAKLQEFAPGSDRASALHAMMDRELSAAGKLPVACREGCAGCCHYEVEITQDEAALLREVVQAGFPIDHERLAKQAARERQSPEWSRFWSRDNRCVFLGENGGCQVYASRPAICRKHLVTTPARACTTPGASVAPVQVLLAEILLSAATSLEGTKFASLPKMLAAALAAEKNSALSSASVSA